MSDATTAKALLSRWESELALLRGAGLAERDIAGMCGVGRQVVRDWVSEGMGSVRMRDAGKVDAGLARCWAVLAGMEADAGAGSVGFGADSA